MQTKPAIVALQKEGILWSYRKLSDHVVRLAASLAEAGLCRGERVAILAGNSPEWVVACLAVIQTGGVAVPLDVQLAANALNQVLKDSSVRLVFTTSGNLQRLRTVSSDPRLTPILLDSEPSDPRGWHCMLGAGSVSWPEPAPEETATLFYTSGTTGCSKGVPLGHRNLVFQLNSIIAANLLAATDRLLLPLPLHHAYPYVIGMLLPLGMGLPIVMPQALTGPQMMRAIREGAVTAVVGVPRLFEAFYSGIEARVESAGTLRRFKLSSGLNLLEYFRPAKPSRSAKLRVDTGLALAPLYFLITHWRPAIAIEKKARALRQPFQNVDGRYQAVGVFCKKGGRSMFDVDLIVLVKVVIYNRREIGAVHGFAEEDEWEEVMRVYSRVRSGLIRQ